MTHLSTIHQIRTPYRDHNATLQYIFQHSVNCQHFHDHPSVFPNQLNQHLHDHPFFPPINTTRYLLLEANR